VLLAVRGIIPIVFLIVVLIALDGVPVFVAIKSVIA